MSRGRGGVLGAARLDARLDRRQLLAWAASLGAVTAVVAAAFDRLYPTPGSRAKLRVLAADPTLRALIGPLADWRTTGGLVAWREGTALALALSLATTFLVVRRTRGEEQHGRHEVLLALPLRRRAPVGAALLAAVALDVLGGGASAVALLADYQGVGSTVLFGATLALVAACFGALAALLAQFAGTSRGANGAAAGAVLGSYLAVALGNLAAGGVLWVTPLGWVQEVTPYGHPRPLVLLCPALLGIGAGAAALALSSVRDLGTGLRRPRAPRSRRVGGSTSALAWRLERTTMLVTIVSVAAYGAVAGSLVARIPSLLRSSPGLLAMIERIGGTRVIADAFTTYLVALGAIALGAWGLALVLRVHTEETHGRVAVLLAAGATRTGVLDGFAQTAGIAAGAGTATFGLAVGAGRAIADHRVASLADGLVAGLVAAPAALVLVGLAVLCAGASRRWAWVPWLAAGWCGSVTILGSYLGLPGWLLDTSPFRHVASVPLRSGWWIETLALAAIAVALSCAGRLGYARRELGGA